MKLVWAKERHIRHSPEKQVYQFVANLLPSKCFFLKFMAALIVFGLPPFATFLALR